MRGQKLVTVGSDKPESMKYLITLIFLVFARTDSYSQNAEQNLMKYWKHRSQLDRFILKGEGINPATVHGSYLPAEFCRPVQKSGHDDIGGGLQHFQSKWPDLYYTAENPKCGGLNIGADATMYLGWYISVLATEYKLLVDHGLDGASTLHELWSALEAYERLDRMAETLLGQPPQYNGYFLRDDAIFNLATRDDNNDGVPNFPEIGCVIGKFEFMIASGKAHYNNFPANPYDVTVDNWNDYDNSPSPDQVLGLLQGVALVKKCVPANASVNGQSVRLKAQEIAHRIGSYARPRHYKMTNADGNGNDGTIDMKMVCYPIAETINWITDDNDESLDFNQDGIGDVLGSYHTQDYPPLITFPPSADFSPDSDGLWQLMWQVMVTQWAVYFTDPLPDWPPNGTICALDALFILTPMPFIGPLISVAEDEANDPNCWDMEDASHLAQMYTAAAISNEWIHTDFYHVAHEIDMEIFPLLSDVLFDEDDMSIECKDKCKERIDAAPCSEFGSCKPDTDCIAGDATCGTLSTEAVSGWMSPNRYLHRDWANGVKGSGILHNGLDFLLLYNLYHLKYPNELPYHYTYSNTYSGVMPDAAFYPNGIVSDDIFEQMYSCWACEQTPLVRQNNSIIKSSAKVSSVSGTVLNIDANGNYSMIPVTYNADVTYRAGEEIQLTDGFSVTAGASFHAYIDPFECIGGQLQRVGDESNEDWEDQEITKSVPPSALSAALFPNPTTGQITYNGTGPLGSATVMDLTGRALSTIGLNGAEGPVSIDLSTYRPGTYLLRVQYLNGKAEVHRVVRQ